MWPNKDWTSYRIRKTSMGRLTSRTTPTENHSGLNEGLKCNTATVPMAMVRTYVTERRAYSAEGNNNVGEPSEVSSLLSR